MDIKNIKEFILFEDQHLVVCEKISGFPVQSAKFGQKDMETLLKTYLSMTVGKKANERVIPYLGVIHRLDQPVEGILVFAKTPKAAKGLSQQIATGKMTKKYYAVVCGEKEAKIDKEVILQDYLWKDGKTNTSKVVSKETKGSKLGVLSYTALEQTNEFTLVDITLGTGRHHQIRVQMSHHNMPLYGDTKYNKNLLNKDWKQIALCAYQLKFVHPITNKKMEFSIKPKGEIFHTFSYRL